MPSELLEHFDAIEDVRLLQIVRFDGSDIVAVRRVEDFEQIHQVRLEPLHHSDLGVNKA
jgi:hypothetical protein